MVRPLAHEVRQPRFGVRPVPMVASADGLLRDDNGRWNAEAFQAAIKRFGWIYNESAPRMVIPLPGVDASGVGLGLLAALSEVAETFDIHVQLTWKIVGMPDVSVDINGERAKVKTLTVVLVASEYRGRTERMWWRGLVEQELLLYLESEMYSSDLREMFRNGLVQLARGPEYVILAWGDPEDVRTKCFESVVPGRS